MHRADGGAAGAGQGTGHGGLATLPHLSSGSLPSLQRVTGCTAGCYCPHSPKASPAPPLGHYPVLAAEPWDAPVGWGPPKPPPESRARPRSALRMPSPPTAHTSSSQTASSTRSRFPGRCLCAYLYYFNTRTSRNGGTCYITILTKYSVSPECPHFGFRKPVLSSRPLSS